MFEINNEGDICNWVFILVCVVNKRLFEYCKFKVYVIINGKFFVKVDIYDLEQYEEIKLYFFEELMLFLVKCDVVFGDWMIGCIYIWFDGFNY